ncbi:MAG: type II toxin-antitoxin system VapC family toxin [Desulfobacteraceae bacterium]|nr:type II toxin-antitoxin system VapC family toxin [Desulfobacteraceae bacterium]
MIDRLFVDTAGWMAMADSKDPLHLTSLHTRDRWLEKGGILTTSNYVLDEMLTLIRMRLGNQATEKWWTRISESPRCSVEWISPERAGKAVRWFFDWKDQSFSFTDCTSFIVMRELGIEKVLTGDRHFTTAGFQILP